MRNEIITKLFNDTDLNQCIRKMKPSCLQDELKSELFLQLCEMPEERLLEMWNSKTIKLYLARTIVLMMASSTSAFYRKYRKNEPVEFNTNLEIKEEQYIEPPDPEELLKELYWYDQTIIRLYAKHGSIRKVSTETNIPVTSIYNTIKRVKECLK